MNYTDHFRTRKQKTAQREQNHGAVANNAGGFSFAVSEWNRLDRFLILGSEDGTYYVSERELTRECAQNLQACIALDGKRVVERIIHISQAGRAAKNDMAIFALAMCTGLGDEATRQLALHNLARVVRTGSHLFMFVKYVQGFRGWGRGLKRAVSDWYNQKSPDQLCYQVTKYAQRGGWSHRDILRLAHATPSSEYHKALYDWICAQEDAQRRRKAEQLFPQIEAIAQLRATVSVAEACQLIRQHRLPRETVPTELLKQPAVWQALLEHMPVAALIRCLNRMSHVGLLKDFSEAEKIVLHKINEEALAKARVHPIAVLSALMTYKRGVGVLGNLRWRPATRVVQRLEEAFYESFGNVVPTNKRVMLALDVSSSMFWGSLAGSVLTPGDAAAALAMIFKATEQNCIIKAFSHRFIDLTITKNMSIQEVVRLMRAQGFGGTDCALPMLFAKQQKVPVDAFVVLTDNDTWGGDIYPSEALRDYRQASGIDAKLIVCGMVSNGFTIADPQDAGMMDVVGFDTAAPQTVNSFIRGSIYE